MRLPDVDRLLFLAGGIGITPILPMIRAAAADGRDWNLVYAGRHGDRMYALEELVNAYGPRVVPHFSALHGRLEVESLLSGAVAPQAIVCCGPPSLMAAAQVVSGRAGVPFVMEAFRSESTGNAGAARASSGAVEERGEFTVSLARGGIDVRVRPNESVLEALESAGAVIASSCREGYCGTCETVVLEGSVDHRDTVLTPEEHADTDLMGGGGSRCMGQRLILDL
jgi:ferredoxin-NADP reductase